jgi:undecaprenyl-phosphate galactose phosphotransferase
MNAELELATDELVILYDKKISQYVFMFFKRVFDILCSLVGLVVLIPLMIIVKITYVLSGDMHSIFYTQNRVGMNGKIFKLYKFRTMVPNADDMLK